MIIDPFSFTGTSGNGNLATARSGRAVHHFIKLKGRGTIFNAPNTNINTCSNGTAIQSGAIYLITMGTAGNGANTYATISDGNSRLRFVG